MFRTRDDESILRIHKKKQLLKMFRSAMTVIATLKLVTLHISISADFFGDEFKFCVTVFEINGTNTSLSIYDFWEIEKSKELLEEFITAIKSDDFKKVQAAIKYCI